LARVCQIYMEGGDASRRRGTSSSDSYKERLEPRPDSQNASGLFQRNWGKIGDGCGLEERPFLQHGEGAIATTCSTQACDKRRQYVAYPVHDHADSRTIVSTQA
jgi:hypothetical protein